MNQMVFIHEPGREDVPNRLSKSLNTILVLLF
jgi:hypothetical protein